MEFVHRCKSRAQKSLAGFALPWPFHCFVLPAVQSDERASGPELDGMEGGKVRQINPDRLDGLLLNQFQ